MVKKGENYENDAFTNDDSCWIFFYHKFTLVSQSDRPTIRQICIYFANMIGLGFNRSWLIKKWKSFNGLISAIVSPTAR